MTNTNPHRPAQGPDMVKLNSVAVAQHCSGTSDAPQVISWVILHWPRKPTLSSWHVVAPAVALSEVIYSRGVLRHPYLKYLGPDPQLSNGNTFIKSRQLGFEAVVTYQPCHVIFSYLALLHLHRATRTSIKTIPSPSFDLYCLIQQQIICLPCKITADKCKVFFPAAIAWKYIWNILWVHCTPDGNIYDCFLSGYIKISSSNFTTFINSTFILNVHSVLENFLSEHHKWVCDLFGMLGQMTKKRIPAPEVK